MGCKLYYDVETDFLCGNLEKLVYITIPQRLNNLSKISIQKQICLLLKKAIYGLSKLQNNSGESLFQSWCKSSRFKKDKADACVPTREENHGVIIFCIYVYDAFMVGYHTAIEKTVAQLKSKVSLKDGEAHSEYVLVAQR
jgi:Reverse transcriptase (RNA-dependent DNA polymerase)